MPRYAAFLRGVSPMNAKMAELQHCFEKAGFGEVKTVLSSGNVIFNTRATSIAALERKVEAAMKQHLDRSFYTIVRPVDGLLHLLERNPYASFRLPANAKKVVTFLREPHKGKVVLPPEVDGARILSVESGEIFTAYVSTEAGPVFMRLIEKTFGTNLTTRTWDTVRKCAAS